MAEIAAILTDRVEQMRLARGLTVEQVAMIGAIARTTISEFRSGETVDPRLSTVLKVCTGLGVAPEALLTGLPTPAPRSRPNGHASTGPDR
jgi:transcriptional regulator with XRE-family HTH domain